MLHRKTFVTKKELRAYYEKYKTEYEKLRDLYLDLTRRHEALEKTNSNNNYQLDELRNQVSSQTRILTSTKVAAEQSHKALDDSHKAYAKAFNRANELQQEVYDLQERIRHLEDTLNRSIWSRFWEWVITRVGATDRHP